MRLSSLHCVALAVTLSTGALAAEAPAHFGHGGVGSPRGAANFSPLVEKVRLATSRFVDVNVALHEGWVRGTPCVSGPMGGAMGVHFILPTRLRDGALNASEPEALIYEPMPNGALRRVGVEFIVVADDYAAAHPEGGTPGVDGHLTHYVGAPNRYGLPAFYVLHAWACEHNPNGSLADWNSEATCDSTPAPDPAPAM